MLLITYDRDGNELATGTGFLVSKDGKLVTNFHVIADADRAVAKAENGGQFAVEGVLATDLKNDLSLLKLDAKDQPFLSLGGTTKVEPGQHIAVIGSPLGLEGTVSDGIVSAVRDLVLDIRRIQITAAISPGSSGSPVIDDSGEVIGVASYLMRGAQSLNFAVPAEAARDLLSAATEKPASLAADRGAHRSADSDMYRSDEWKSATAAQQAGDWVQMFKAGQTLTRRFPDCAEAHLVLGLSSSALGFYDDAIAPLRQAIRLKPDLPEAWCGLGATYALQYRYDDGVFALRQAIKLRPDYAMAWCTLGVVYEKQGKRSEALAASSNCRKLNQSLASSPSHN
jgi:tetratricopeptide (TPR) repeat protein